MRVISSGPSKADENEEKKDDKKNMLLISAAFGIGTLTFFLCVSAVFYFSVDSELFKVESTYCRPVTAMKLTYHPITEIMEEIDLMQKSASA
ncbi:Oidioi.mRNA.OKI2018_I69.PAR.g8926.t1.cds [Oikopleura dioica]|uniref:Oidioi.mRNA.OKI2018_I69.PAR.g8926.t1.cds n=1 Tax=Oikopleura dioica TaxID=34765 RepID=A0ABN7RI91_OIKDI|nr:Oidioi.mRNA.OKI2018_I69.PAR.g8926.t1.cds [Oikopleura dioica]